MKRLAKAHLRVSRQRKDFAVKTARALVISSDMVAYEDLKIAHLVKNHRLAKSISDASWGLFLSWVRYYGQISNVPIVAVSPRFTSQECSGCGFRVQKSLSVRTHVCLGCGLLLDRDWNAALNILLAALASLAAKHRRASCRSDRALDEEIALSGRRQGTGKGDSRGRLSVMLSRPLLSGPVRGPAPGQKAGSHAPSAAP